MDVAGFANDIMLGLDLSKRHTSIVLLLKNKPLKPNVPRAKKRRPCDIGHFLTITSV